jgi:hypothetical protein
MPQNEGPPEPWRSFFAEVDLKLQERLELHCFGGFVVVQLYGVARTTNDVDFISMVPNPLLPMICEIGGKGSRLHKKYRVHLDPVTVVTPPDGYESRLQALFPGTWKNLNLFGLEAHDLALTKLERNYERDRDDVQRLAAAGLLDKEVLRERYLRELRPYLSREAWHDQTLQLWLEAYWPD